MGPQNADSALLRRSPMLVSPDGYRIADAAERHWPRDDVKAQQTSHNQVEPKVAYAG